MEGAASGAAQSEEVHSEQALSASSLRAAETAEWEGRRVKTVTETFQQADI